MQKNTFIEDFHLGCNIKQQCAKNSRYLINYTKVSNGMYRKNGILKLQKKGISMQKHAKYISMVNRKIGKTLNYDFAPH